MTHRRSPDDSQGTAARLTDRHESFDPALSQQLLDIYDRLHRHYGHESHWWPIFTSNWRWEIIVGAILVQQTMWERVEQAIHNLERRGLIDERALAAADIATITEAIRPVAYYNAKAPSLKRLAQYMMDHYGGSVSRLLEQPTAELRHELLALPHVGPETADTILLYAGHHPSFVIDAYLRRIFGRLGTIPQVESRSYESLRHIFESSLPDDLDLSRYPHLGGDRARLFWDYHALIVEHGIHHCLPRRPRCDETSAPRRNFAQAIKCADHCPPCDGCPLREVCGAYQAGIAQTASR
jgi:endonuclease III related protein